MSLRKLFLFSVATLALLTGASAQNIQVDGLQAEEVNASFGDREVTFTASYLNKSITYGKLLVPDELRGDLVDLRSNGRVRTVVDGVGIFQPPGQQDRRLSLAYKFRNDASVPELQGWQYGEFSGNRNSGLKPKNGEGTVLLDAEGRDRVFTSNFSDQGVRWNITVESHYEHLIINYDLIYNESGQPAEIVWETQDVYSGEEPDLVPIPQWQSGEIDSNGDTSNYLDFTYDNLYSNSSEYITVYTIYSSDLEFRNFDTTANFLSEIEGDYGSFKKEAISNGMRNGSLVGVQSGNYSKKVFNVSVPSDSKVHLNFTTSSSSGPDEAYMYIEGSTGGGGGTVENETYTLDGEYAQYSGGGQGTGGMEIIPNEKIQVEMVNPYSYLDGYPVKIRNISGGEVIASQDDNADFVEFTDEPVLYPDFRYFVFVDADRWANSGSNGDLTASYNLLDIVEGKKECSSSGSSCGNTGNTRFMYWREIVVAPANNRPVIESTSFVDDRKTGIKDLSFDIDSQGDLDLSNFSGVSNMKEFTNSSLRAGISLPFSSRVEVSDFDSAYGYKNITLSESDSGLREHSFSHSLATQRINKTVSIFNSDTSSIEYNLTLQNYGAVIQGESWNGTIPASSSVRHTGVWENDWITGETESSFDKYEDSGFDHGEDEQVLVNQTQLVVDNSRSFQFSGVDLSSVCGRTTTGDVPSGQSVTVTTDCNRPTFTVDFIDDSNSSLLEDGAFGHGLDTQRVSRRKNLTETGGYSWTGVNVSSPEMPGSCVNCGQREVDVAADSTSAVYYNSTGDWIDASVEVFEKGQYGVADLDQQSFYNQTSLEASNSQSFRFHSVDLSSKCSVTTSGDVPPGSSTVTTSCTNSTFSGDWIQNEVNESTRFQEGSVVVGDGVSELYRAGQNVSVENTRSDVNLTVDFSSKLVEEQGCSVVDSVRTVRASTVAEFQFEKLCSPGEVLNHEPVQKTETATQFKYTYRGEFEVYSNLTEEEPITFAVEKSRLSNFEERLPTETEVYVNGRGSGLSVDQRYFNDTEYVTVEVPDDFGNSSLHEGSHSVKLVYYESKSPGGTSGGGSTGGGVVGGGSSQPQETVENVTGEYNWTVSAAVASDTQKFTVARAPGDTFEKQILLENTGSEEVPLNISCTSQDGFCRYVDLEVDRVVLNTGSFNQKQVTVTGNIPANASAGSSYTFRILVEDPSSTGLGSEGAATVDFLVTVSDFFGGIVSYANKLTEWRELESPFGIGNPIPYPFVLLPLLSSAVVGVAVLGIRRLLEVESSALVQASHFGLIVLTFLVSVPLWP